jgi:hypothetical protein
VQLPARPSSLLCPVVMVMARFCTRSVAKQAEDCRERIRDETEVHTEFTENTEAQNGKRSFSLRALRDLRVKSCLLLS